MRSEIQISLTDHGQNVLVEQLVRLEKKESMSDKRYAVQTKTEYPRHDHQQPLSFTKRVNGVMSNRANKGHAWV